jgi:hypothetical protein
VSRRAAALTLAGFLILFAVAPAAALVAEPEPPVPADSTSAILHFRAVWGDSLGAGEEPVFVEFEENDEEEWLSAPFGEHLLTDPSRWRTEISSRHVEDVRVDYNRVDQLRLGLWHQWQAPRTLYPRIGARLDYSFGRERMQYGFQIEQPLVPNGRVSAGVSSVRRTDHLDLQQTDDFENSLALLFGRQDYRDYFEREGYGGYLSWRVPDFSTVSVHLRSDDYRSLDEIRSTRSWLMRDRPLRDNPAIDDGSIHSALVRLERLVYRTRSTRAGLYHWIEIERAGASLGGDHEYTRALADARSILRLSPATTLSLRSVIGSTLAGVLPRQRQFVAGGVDGLRAHSFSEFRGDQLALAQIEYAASLWPYVRGWMNGGFQVLLFADAGLAWSNSEHHWDLGRQHAAIDGGIGIASAEDHLRVYFARDLRANNGATLVQLRLQKPF